MPSPAKRVRDLFAESGVLGGSATAAENRCGPLYHDAPLRGIEGRHVEVAELIEDDRKGDSLGDRMFGGLSAAGCGASSAGPFERGGWERLGVVGQQRRQSGKEDLRSRFSGIGHQNVADPGRAGIKRRSGLTRNLFGLCAAHRHYVAVTHCQGFKCRGGKRAP